MPSSSDPTNPTPPTPDSLPTLSLAQVLRALGLETAAAHLDAAAGKAIARQDAPLSLLDALMREELRAQLERRAKLALKRSGIFPLTTLDSFDFDYPKSIDRELVLRAASLDFLREKANCVFVGPPELPT
jgi:DNA replication protein DnaC